MWNVMVQVVRAVSLAAKDWATTIRFIILVTVISGVGLAVVLVAGGRM